MEEIGPQNCREEVPLNLQGKGTLEIGENTFGSVDVTTSGPPVQNFLIISQASSVFFGKNFSISLKQTQPNQPNLDLTSPIFASNECHSKLFVSYCDSNSFERCNRLLLLLPKFANESLFPEEQTKKCDPRKVVKENLIT